jgi:hypothetical protein
MLNVVILNVVAPIRVTYLRCDDIRRVHVLAHFVIDDFNLKILGLHGRITGFVH